MFLYLFASFLSLSSRAMISKTFTALIVLFFPAWPRDWQGIMMTLWNWWMNSSSILFLKRKEEVASMMTSAVSALYPFVLLKWTRCSPGNQYTLNKWETAFSSCSHCLMKLGNVYYILRYFLFSHLVQCIFQIIIYITIICLVLLEKKHINLSDFCIFLSPQKKLGSSWMFDVTGACLAVCIVEHVGILESIKELELLHHLTKYTFCLKLESSKSRCWDRDCKASHLLCK